MTTAGIEPATFRFVAQHLNHCATAGPPPLPSIHIKSVTVQLYLQTAEEKFGFEFMKVKAKVQTVAVWGRDTL